MFSLVHTYTPVHCFPRNYVRMNWIVWRDFPKKLFTTVVIVFFFFSLNATSFWSLPVVGRSRTTRRTRYPGSARVKQHPIMRRAGESTSFYVYSIYFHVLYHFRTDNDSGFSSATDRLRRLLRRRGVSTASIVLATIRVRITVPRPEQNWNSAKPSITYIQQIIPYR